MCCLMLCAQVGFSCFYSAIYHRELYPTFSSASGRAGSRYADIFEAISKTFELKTFEVFVNTYHKPSVEMAGYLNKTLGHAGAEFRHKFVDIESPASIRSTLEAIKKEKRRTGLCFFWLC